MCKLSSLPRDLKKYSGKNIIVIVVRGPSREPAGNYYYYFIIIKEEKESILDVPEDFVGFKNPLRINPKLHILKLNCKNINKFNTNQFK